MTNIHSTSNHKLIISAVVKRADGTEVDLHQINGRFPWRAWLYRLKFWVKQLKEK